MLFVDLRRWNTNIYEKKYVYFDDTQIEAIKKIYNDWQTGENYKDVPELCKAATLEDIRKQNYSLAPSKYIEFIDRDLQIDYEKEMARIQTEVKDILKAENKSQIMLETAFKGIGYNVTEGDGD